MNLKNRKYMVPVTAFTAAFFLVTAVHFASAQTSSSSQNGSMHMSGNMVRQQAQDPPAGCGANGGKMAHNQGTMSGGMMSGMMGGSGGHMSGGMMSGMMGGNGSHMSGGMMSGMMRGNGSHMSGMMGGMHSDKLLTFSEALGLSDEQIKKIEELELTHARALVDAQSAIRKAELDVQAARMQTDDIRGLKQALQQAAEAGIELEIMQVRQAAAINGVLTADQRLKWSNLYSENGCNMVGDMS